MAKDVQKKARGIWWRGWVEYSFNSFGTRRTAVRLSGYECATKAEAVADADILAARLRRDDPDIEIIDVGAAPATGSANH